MVWETRGNVLLGFAIIIFVLLNRDNPILTGRYVWFSLIFGVVMANILGFLAGLFIDDLGGRTDAVFTGLLERSLNLADVDPSVLLFMLISSPIVLIGYPIWLLWTGRLFLKSAGQYVNIQ